MDNALFVKMSNRMINIKFRVETLAHAPYNKMVIILFKCGWLSAFMLPVFVKNGIILRSSFVEVISNNIVIFDDLLVDEIIFKLNMKFTS